MTETTQREAASEVLFEGSWHFLQSLAMIPTVIVTFRAIALGSPFLFVVVAALWWWVLRREVRRVELTRAEVILHTTLATRRIRIEDIAHVGHWYGTIWERGKLFPWDIPFGRQRGKLFYLLDELRESSRGTT